MRSPFDDLLASETTVPTEIIDSAGVIGRELDLGKFKGAKVALVHMRLEGNLPATYFFSDNGALITIKPTSMNGRFGFIVLFGEVESRPTRMPGRKVPDLALKVEGQILHQVTVDDIGVTVYLDHSHLTFDQEGLRLHGKGCKCRQIH